MSPFQGYFGFWYPFDLTGEEKEIETAPQIMVLITEVTTEGSGQPAHPQSHQSLRCSHTRSMEVDDGFDQKSDI